MANSRTDRVIVDVTIAAPIDTVWQAVCDPDQISNWFGWDAETLKDEIDFIFSQHAHPDAALHVLQFDEYEGIQDRFELTAEGNGTRLRVVRAGPAEDGWENVFEEMTEGWLTFVAQLRFGLEQHRGEKRRTLYFSGKAVRAIPLPQAALGLSGVSSGSVALPTADLAQGPAWHSSAFQTGIAVPGWGQGLLVVMDRPVTPDRPFGGGSAVLTTFGLDDQAFENLRGRWADWWAERYG